MNICFCKKFIEENQFFTNFYLIGSAVHLSLTNIYVSNNLSNCAFYKMRTTDLTFYKMYRTNCRLTD